MEKQELLSQKLYYLTVAGYTPLKMNNEFILVYSDCEKIDIAKSNFSKRYGEIHAVGVTDNTEFIKQMLLSGCEKFIYNGNGSIYKFNDFYDGAPIVPQITAVQSPSVPNPRPQYAQRVIQPRDKNASTSLACGIISMIFPIPVLPVLALVFGIMSINNAKKEDRANDGKAIAGVVLGGLQILSTVIGIIFLIFMIISGKVQI